MSNNQVRPRNVRHRDYDRLRHSDHMKAWLVEQAARLEQTEEYVFETLLRDQGLTYEQVENLPAPEPEPDPEG